jgi:molybdopterin biosynthesis enzyme
MRQDQFLDVIDRDEAERRFHAVLDLRPLDAESIPLSDALGRVLAEDVVAPTDGPGFDRSNLDSFAVRAEDAFLPGRPPPPVFLLPGNPVSCLCAYDLFAGRAVRRLGGRSVELPYQRVRLPLSRKISSAVGRVDYVRVVIRDGKVEPLATSGASILSSTTRADGFVLVPRDSEGQGAGEEVDVFLYDC